MANGIVLNIDTTKSEFQNPMIELRQGDGNYQSLDVTVTSNGSPFNLTGWTITFMGTTAGGFKIVDSSVSNVDTANGKFTYTPTKSWGQDQGEFKNAYFKFTKSDETASGASFRVNVLDAVDLTAEEAGDYISVVDGMINDLTTDLNALQKNVDDLKAKNLAIKTTDNTWTGGNTFNKKIIAPAGVQGNADTATKLQTPRKINGTNFDGTSDINVNAANDANLVHNTGSETVAGNKTFTGIANFSQQISGGLATRDATFTDFATVYASMNAYSGNWRVTTGSIVGSPVSGVPYVLTVVNYGVNAGQIILTTLSGKKTYITGVSGGMSTGWILVADDASVIHNTGTETVSGNKTFTGDNNFSGATTLKTGNYGLRVTTTGIQKTSDGGTTWVNI